MKITKKPGVEVIELKSEDGQVVYQSVFKHVEILVLRLVLTSRK